MSTNAQEKSTENTQQEIDENVVDNIVDIQSDQFFEQAKNDKISSALMNDDVIPKVSKKGNDDSLSKSTKKSKIDDKKKVVQKKKIDDKPKLKNINGKLSVLPVIGFLSLSILGGVFVSNYYSDKAIHEQQFNDALGVIRNDVDVRLNNVTTIVSEVKDVSLVEAQNALSTIEGKVTSQQAQIDEMVKAKQATEFGGESLYYETQSLKKELASKDLAIKNLQNQMYALQNTINKVDFNKLAKVNLNKVINPTPPKPVTKTPVTTTKKAPTKKVVYAKTLYTISGYSLFSIDMFGSEKIAVFTKGLESKKVRLNETFEGYSIDNILSDSGVIYFSKNGKRYSMKVKA